MLFFLLTLFAGGAGNQLLNFSVFRSRYDLISQKKTVNFFFCSSILYKLELKMRFKKVKKQEIDGVIKKGGKSPSTLKKRKSVLKTVSKFLIETERKSLDEYIADLKLPGADVTEFQDFLLEFFSSLELENGEKPKKTTISGYQTNIKMHLLKETDDKINIMDPIKFAKFCVSKFSLKFSFCSSFLFYLLQVV